MFTFWRHESKKRIAHSATEYEDIDLATVDYEPESPFKGVYVGGTGNITIQGLDGNEETLMGIVGGATHPLGGLKIIRATTTATDLKALR